MSTKSPRINISLDTDTNMLLKNLAEMKNQSVSALAKSLIFEALELHEDRVLSAIAEERDQEDAKRLKFEDVFK